MSKITALPDGSYGWSCSIDADYHRQSTKNSIGFCLVFAAVVLVVSGFIALLHQSLEAFWIPVLVIAVIAVLAFPLFFLQMGASSPQEQYLLTPEYVKSGYGKSAVFSRFDRTDVLVLKEHFIELKGKYGENRIYIPAEDMEFVKAYILERIPKNTIIIPNS